MQKWNSMQGSGNRLCKDPEVATKTRRNRNKRSRLCVGDRPRVTEKTKVPGPSHVAAGTNCVLLPVAK